MAFCSTSVLLVLLIISIFGMLCCAKAIFEFNGQRDNSLGRFKRVKNGIETAPFSRPWMARLYSTNSASVSPGGVCGAFLITRPPNHMSHMEHGSSDIVLTAAHCIKANIKHYYVSFGRHNVSADNEPNKLDVFVEHALIHRHYCFGKSKKCASNDIAMLKLTEPVVFNEFIKPLALSNSSSLHNCSMSGWGSSDGALSSILLNNITDFGSYVEAVTAENTKIVQGDSGGPIVCLLNEHSVVRGIVSKGGGWFEQFSDTVENLQWIIDTYKEIDSPDKPYHPELVPYAQSRKYRSANVQQSLNWLSNYINEKNLEVMPQEQLDYVDFSTSKELMCSYLATFKRCYLSFAADDHMCNMMPAGQSVVLTRKPRDYFKLSAVANNDNNSTKKQLRLQQSWTKWEVSARVAERPNFHCLGDMMPSLDLLFYSHVSFSSDCLRGLRKAIPADARIQIIARFENALVEIDAHNKFKKIGNGLTQTFEITPIRIPDGYPSIFGHYKPEESLKAIMYSPYSGAFRSKPDELSFIIRFDMQDNNTCMGVLIDSMQLMNHRTKQRRQQLVLTSANCAKRMLNRSAIGTRGAYFLNEENSDYNQMTVASVHIHPDYLDSKSPQRQKTVHNIAIVVMCSKIEISKRIAQSIQLPSHPVPLNSSFVIATWNVSDGDTRLPLYKVPVEIDITAIKSEKNPKKLLTRRLHLYGDSQFDNELQGRALLAYDEQSEDFTLAGFYSRTTGKRSKLVEAHVAIYPHLQWIRETLEKNKNHCPRNNS